MSRVLCMATAVWIAALPGVIAAQSTTSSAPSPAAQKVRIGVFDSRMVAIAYYNSGEQRKFMQDLMHYQVFSNASIPNVMEKLAPELPKIAADSHVSIIVSKWEVAFHDPNVEYVDVTDALVARFKPTAQVQKWIDSGKSQQPVPLLEAVMTLRPER